MIATAALFFAASTATAAAQTPAAPPCAGAMHHQLDFWIGDWAVFQQGDDKTQIATSRIESVMTGCGIRENYSAPNAPGGAYAGTSYSGYDRNDGKWHQMYVDTNGNVTWYTGGLESTDMVLHAPAAKGALQMMTYRPQSDGSVRQIGVVSTDGGKTWTPSYDYVYRKR